MRVLVTGGSGFIGTNIIERYLQRGDEVLNLDIVKPRNPKHNKFWEKVDIANAHLLEKKLKNFKPELVFHMAARTDLEGNSIDAYRANTDGVKNLIDILFDIPETQRVIFASSRLVCRIGYQPQGNFDYCPSTVYGQSKVIGEKIVHSYDELPFEWLIVRPTSIWGPWFDVPYKDFFTHVLGGKYFHPGNEKIYKSFGYIGNTIHELEKLMYAKKETVNKSLFYLADYHPIEVYKMAQAIRSEVGLSNQKRVPLWVLIFLAHVGDGLKKLGWKSPPLTSFRLSNLLTQMVFQLDPLEKIVGVLPYDMERGVSETIAWMKEQNKN